VLPLFLPPDWPSSFMLFITAWLRRLSCFPPLPGKLYGRGFSRNKRSTGGRLRLRGVPDNPGSFAKAKGLLGTRKLLV
jgi:hypothetical protein